MPRTPVKPLGEAKEDWRIALEIGCLVDKPENFFYGDPVKACNAVLKVWEGNYEKAVAALPAVSTLKCEKNEPYKYVSGKLRPDGKPGFNTPTGKLELFSTITSKYGLEGLPVYKEMMKPEGDFNLRLINGTRKPYITHSKTRSDAPYLLELEPVSTIHMNPADAKKRGLVTGNFVEMRSKFGGPVRARIDVSIIVPEGTIDSQYGWRGGQNTQNLIPRQWDPISGYAPYFEVNVSVAKVRTAGPDTSATRSRSSSPSPRPSSGARPRQGRALHALHPSSRRRASARLRRKLLDQGPTLVDYSLEGSRSPGAHQALRFCLSEEAGTQPKVR